MRALASDREITATLGVPVRRVEMSAWLGSGVVCGVAGLLLADLFTTLDYTALTFLVISSLAAALIGRLRSLWVTLAGGLAVGLLQAVATPYDSITDYRTAAPFVLAIVALLYLGAPSHRHDLADDRVAACCSETQVRRSTRGTSYGAAQSIVVFLGIVLFVLPPSSAGTGSRPSRASRSTRSSPRAS